MVVGHKTASGPIHVGQVVVHVADQSLTIDMADGDTRTIRHTTTQPILRVKAQRPSGRQGSG